MRKFLPVFVLICFTYKQSTAQLSLDHILDSGVLITGGINSIAYYNAVSDGKGGAIILYQKNTNLDTIFAQRISSDGKLMWGTTLNPKIAATKNNTSNSSAFLIDVISDTKGGIFFSYMEEGIDQNSNLLFESYIQHIDSNGTNLIANNGVKIIPKNYSVKYAMIVSDGGSGVIATWEEQLYDYEKSRNSNSEIFAQKYNSLGVPQWVNGGVQVCSGNGLRMAPVISSDGNNGAVIVFEDSRNCIPADSLYNTDIYAQRIDNNGNLKWTANGLPVSLKAGNQSPWEVFMQPNKNNFSISYSTYVTSPRYYDTDINVQQLNINGMRTWSANGIRLDTLLDDGNFEKLKIKSDGKGGVVAFWGKYKYVSNDVYDYSLIQRIDSATGNLLWPSSKINLINDPKEYSFANDLISDAAGNLIFSVLPYNDTAGYSRLQKINTSGTAQWGPGGKDYWFVADMLVPQADGSIIAISNEITTSDGTLDYSNIAAYKIDSNGVPVWRTAPFKTLMDGDWNDPSIWEAGVVPAENSNVVVANNILISADVVCNSLKISPGGKVTVANGIHLTVLH